MAEIPVEPEPTINMYTGEWTYVDDDGKPMSVRTKVVENEYDYALRYEEFVPLIIKLSQIQEDCINKLEKENSDLKACLDKLEAILTK